MKKTLSLVFALCMLSPLGALAEETVRIPASGDTTTGYIGCDINASQCNKDDVQKVEIKAFYMDVHEATRGEVKQCFMDGKCANHGSEQLKKAFTEISEDEKDQPATLDFDLAKVYCENKGMRLPTEAEWLAAAMGNSIKDYVWGDKFERTAATSYTDNYKVNIEPVMSYPTDQSQGIYDLNGSAPEWIEGPKRGEASRYCADGRTCPAMGDIRVPLYQKLSFLCYPDRYIGVRCAKDAN